MYMATLQVLNLGGKSLRIVERLIRNGWTGKSGLYVSVIPDNHSKDIIKAVASILETELE